MTFETNYQDAQWSGDRKYAMTNHSDGTISLEDRTEYITEGSLIGASWVNAVGTALNNTPAEFYTITGITDSAVNVMKWLRQNATVTMLGTRFHALVNSTYRYTGEIYTDGNGKYWGSITKLTTSLSTTNMWKYLYSGGADSVSPFNDITNKTLTVNVGTSSAHADWKEPGGYGIEGDASVGGVIKIKFRFKSNGELEAYVSSNTTNVSASATGRNWDGTWSEPSTTSGSASVSAAVSMA